MNDQNYFLTIFAGAVMALSTVACSEDSSGGTGGAGNTSTATSTGTGTGTGKALVADKGGFIAKDTNDFGVQGAWYAYADSLGPNGMPPGNCQTIGMHTDAECAKVIAPAPGSPFAPTADGKMCTEGTVEAVLDIKSMPGMKDYSNMWGAGIGLDFNNAGATKLPFDAAAQGITGISFVIDAPPPAGIRVEIPDSATDGKSAAYWGATSSYPPSPLVPGKNSFTWDKIVPPDAAVTPLKTNAIMGIQFHVPSGAAGPYKFCISELTLLK